ncbi:hypothetical protein VFPPC_18219 [Pochonia chlamydosporia 170]|uniref:Uncharacterized protein n=1 Tax=Pochonia chlamydosporia 170 TaxID=1380566 RepID=A0A219AP52_METCM|nr:hypothetical protein VFPPC_18219 [Pochonia chlamydosporia 170]OWT42607.1 hypothetical protein VFPPC_18219 [Pochonia chlamydosporia 170]
MSSCDDDEAWNLYGGRMANWVVNASTTISYVENGAGRSESATYDELNSPSLPMAFVAESINIVLAIAASSCREKSLKPQVDERLHTFADTLSSSDGVKCSMEYTAEGLGCLEKFKARLLVNFDDFRLPRGWV